MYKINYSDIVVTKDIPRLSAPIKSIIKTAIENKLKINPILFGKPLRYNLKNCRRLRVGDYRIIYQLVDQNVNILAIKHRKHAYK